MGILFKTVDDWINRHRAWSLLATVIIIVTMVALINWLTGSDLFRQFFYPKRCVPTSPKTCDPLEWKVLFQATVLMLGLPIAFLLWHWRDRNVRDQIENARKDINLKEFQEVQLRAAGALDERLSPEARTQLQIAALHQLRGFLRGDHGNSFKRPSFELLLAGHAAAIYRVGVPEVQAQVIGKSREEVKTAAAKLRAKLTAIDQARMLIIHEEARHIFIYAYPLNGRRLDFLNLSRIKFPEKIQLASSHFFDANLQKSDLTGLVLRDGHFEGAFLHKTNFENADLFEANLDGSFLYEANLRGANLQRAICENISCLNTAFSNATKFPEFSSNWCGLTESDKDAVRATWISRGMFNVDALSNDI
jgi:Pentapeptide repeats (8 copies)